jgi:hypothetical protein
MGSLVNGCVILILMAMLGLTSSVLDPSASRDVVMLQFAVGTAVSVAMVAWRWLKLKESKVRVVWCLRMSCTAAVVRYTLCKYQTLQA